MNDADTQTLKELNLAVEQALNDRKQWLDKKMAEYARVKVGEELYHLNSGKLLGVVTGHYRYWAGQNPLLDKSLSIDYYYRSVRGGIDNTSRQIGLMCGTKQEAVEALERRMSRMNRETPKGTKP